MKRFIITEDERNQILGLYRSKKLINEQEVGGKVTYNQITTSDDKGFLFFTRNEKRKGTIYYIGSEEFNKALESKDEVRKKIAKDDTESIRIWDFLCGPSGDTIFVANCVRYVQQNDWVEVIEFYDKIGKDSEPGDENVTYFPGEEIKIPDSAPTDKYFINNQWELTPFGQEDLMKHIINPIATSKGSRDGCIDLIKIESSASRYRNTDNAKDLSFLELSKKRNDAVRDFIYSQLKSKGFDKWCKGTENIVQISEGSNKDGSSGPNPPSPTPYVPKGQEKMEPKAPNDAHRNDFGPPHSTPQEYDKYKYSRPTVIVAFSDKIPPPKPEFEKKDPTEIVRTRYQAIFKGNTGVIEIPGSKPSLNLDIPKIQLPRMERKSKSVQCPVFSK